MELLLIRSDKTITRTIGELFVNGQNECFIMEDRDRDLRQDMALEEIKAIKVKGKTAIPTGRYEIAITFSNRFKKYLPLLMNVPGFEGIRIHPGNAPEDTEGCLLPGESKTTDRVVSSRKAFTKLFDKIKAVEKKEKVFITVK